MRSPLASITFSRRTLLPRLLLSDLSKRTTRVFLSRSSLTPLTMLRRLSSMTSRPEENSTFRSSRKSSLLRELRSVSPTRSKRRRSKTSPRKQLSSRLKTKPTSLTFCPKLTKLLRMAKILRRSLRRLKLPSKLLTQKRVMMRAKKPKTSSTRPSNTAKMVSLTLLIVSWSVTVPLINLKNKMPKLSQT